MIDYVREIMVLCNQNITHTVKIMAEKAHID